MSLTKTGPSNTFLVFHWKYKNYTPTPAVSRRSQVVEPKALPDVRRIVNIRIALTRTTGTIIFECSGGLSTQTPTRKLRGKFIVTRSDFFYYVLCASTLRSAIRYKTLSVNLPTNPIASLVHSDRV